MRTQFEFKFEFCKKLSRKISVQNKLTFKIHDHIMEIYVKNIDNFIEKVTVKKRDFCIKSGKVFQGGIHTTKAGQSRQKRDVWSH